MVRQAHRRSLVAYILAALGLLAVTASVVSAAVIIQRGGLAGASEVQRPTCAGSRGRGSVLRRVCGRAQVAGGAFGSRGRHLHVKPIQGDTLAVAAEGPTKPVTASVRPSTPATAGPQTGPPPVANAIEAPGPGPVAQPSPPPVPVESESPPPAPAEDPSPTPAPVEAPSPASAEPPSPVPAEPPEPAPIEPPIPTPAEPQGPPPVETPSTPPPPEPAPESPKVYWGAWIGNQLTGEPAPWDMSALTNFEQMAGKGLSVVNFSAPFANCSSPECSFYGFPSGEFSDIRAHGAIPLYSWGSQSIPVPSNLSEPDFQLSDVISGTYDSYIREFAEAAKAWGHPFFLRFNWEMNGGWFAWAEGVNGNQPGEYVAAWRHVHDIFSEVGATNATWVWCPNVDPDHTLQNLASLYPGDEYVNWTGLDGYNWGTNPTRPDRWRSFDQLYRSTYEQVTQAIAPSKPLIVSEVGSTEYGGSKASWIEEMLSNVPVDYPKIRGLVWFEKYDDGMDWPIESSGPATAAFANGIQSASYAGSQFGSLGPGAVSPAG